MAVWLPVLPTTYAQMRTQAGTNGAAVLVGWSQAMHTPISRMWTTLLVPGNLFGRGNGGLIRRNLLNKAPMPQMPHTRHVDGTTHPLSCPVHIGHSCVHFAHWAFLCTLCTLGIPVHTRHTGRTGHTTSFMALMSCAHRGRHNTHGGRRGAQSRDRANLPQEGGNHVRGSLTK